MKQAKNDNNSTYSKTHKNVPLSEKTCLAVMLAFPQKW